MPADSALRPPPATLNIAAHWLALNQGRAAKIAYRDDAEALSFGGLQERVQRFAAGLAQLGLRREERVLLLLQDCTDWPVAFLGAIYGGFVPVAINTLLPAADYAYLVTHSGASAAVVSGALMDVYAAGCAQTVSRIRATIVSRANSVLPEGCVSFDSLLAADGAGAAAATGADDIAFWLYSSGSTGRPKAVVHTHANLYWTAETFGCQVLRLDESDVVFSAAKLFFAYGLGNGLTFPLSVGATALLLAGRPTPEAVFEIFARQRPTVFCGVPTLYANMMASSALPPPGAGSLRLCVSAGEALPRKVGEQFTEHFGCSIIDGIGSTEMLHIFLSNRADDVRYGTTGLPVPGYEAQLRDADGAVIAAAGEIGELYVRGPSSALCYWSDRERSHSTFQGPWTRTGDKFLREDSGHYVYAGRSDDMLKVSGQYVSPHEVESALMRHPCVLEAAVIGRPDGDGLIKTRAYVVLKPGYTASPELAAELQGFARQSLAPHKYPRAITFLAELPKTATGKIQRFRLRELQDA